MGVRTLGGLCGPEADRPAFTFGGVYYDLDHRAWSVSSVVENDGRIDMPTDAILSLQDPKRQMDRETMRQLGQQGLSAGKIYFELEYAKVHSMFFVERRFFITCGYFEPIAKAKLVKIISMLRSLYHV